MEMTLNRRWYTGESTVGTLTVGDWSCYTLEDVVRDGPKVQGRTAIPAGRYQVVWTYSPKFRVFTPELLAVPGFTHIRVHSGNDADDTEGCILVGTTHPSPNWIGKSRIARDQLFPYIRDSQPDCWITIIDRGEDV